ncbi:hypothetical protein [Acanthopleuribacter pedis]|uniref:Uncharacterized protein n=1 Tax=Acanthopleuribacter pedis TaxID=442870 RepID=A0A8J7U2M9_9BACT|nr:hypothetical protein [Acanthopleuribacter pedis]MBO1317428.1 hypothetical protein [Acanthopleuribacter pedis]
MSATNQPRLEVRLSQLHDTLAEQRLEAARGTAEIEGVHRRLRLLHQRLNQHQRSMHLIQERLKRCTAMLRGLNSK